MSDVTTKLGLAGLVPVIKIDNADDAVPLAKALIAGGLPVAEVTFRTAAAEEAIRRMSQEAPELMIGAGTVLTAEQADKAIAAGATYIVAPGFNPRVVERCLSKGVPVTPGISTPAEAEQAAAMGLKVLKFFPAEQAGGVAMLKTFNTVYPHLKIMPTGGISSKNLAEYAKQPNVHAVGGSWMVTAELINGKQWDKISALCQEAVQVLHSFKLAHIGINAAHEQEAQSVCALLSSMFGYKVKPGNSSIFLDADFEVMKSPYLGKNGHIAIGCNNVDRAIAYFEQKGIRFNEESRRKEGEKTKAIYFADEIGGFALHLVKS